MKPPKPPYELLARADDISQEPTLEWLENEAKHLIDLIGVDGSGSFYEDDPNAGNIAKQCKAYLTRLKKYKANKTNQ